MTDIRDIIARSDMSRFTVGIDHSVLDAARRATSGIDISSFRSLTSATAGIDIASLKALTAATSGIDVSSLKALTAATSGIDVSSLKALAAATAGINTSSFRALKAATVGINSSTFSAMNAAINAPTFRALTAAVAGVDSSLFSAMNAASDNSMFNAMRVATAGIEVSKVLGLRNFPTSLTIDHGWLEEVSNYSEEEVDDICQAASDEIEVTQDYCQLSDQTKKVIIWLILFIWPVIFDVAKGLATNEIYAHLTRANTILPSKSTSEIKAIARGKKTPEFDRSMLKGYRIVTSGALNFRYDPKMKSEIITTLTHGTPLEVVDDSHRTWIQVSVEIDGEEELGWVAKRHTILVK